jgi:hypothetical protein
MKLSKLLTWRAARWAVLAAAVPAVWACNARPLVKPAPAPARTFNGLFQQVVNRDIDIVFMIDNSLSMKPLQTKLTTNFPIFMDVLKKLPGGLPNVHIGVVSSDMGAGPYSAVDIPGCRTGGDAGTFQTMARGTTCGQGSLNAGQNFIIDQDNGAQKNYTGDIAAAFSCIAALGDTGCGFEHQFASVLRALGADGQAPPPNNVGFLRPNAYLGIILITNEDDCSAPPDSKLFDPASRFVGDPLGPLASYRCNEFGHLCGGARPPRTNIPAPPGGTDLTGTCDVDEAPNATLVRVSDVVSRIKALKPGQENKILVAAIAGPTTQYIVETAAATLKDDPNQQWPQVRHSCVEPTQPGQPPEYGDPGVRITKWVTSFGANGVFQPICNKTYEMALQVIATKLGQLLGDPCVDGKVLDTAGGLWATGDANPPDCAVVDHVTNDQGARIDSPVPRCDDANPVPPCWHIAGQGMCKAGQFFLKIERAPGNQATDLNSSVSCSVRVCPPPGTEGAPADCPK